MQHPAHAVGLALLVAVGAFAVPAQAQCTGDVCDTLFTTLRTDIVTGVAPRLQTGLLQKTVASQILAPTDPCRALLPLAALQTQVNSLTLAQQITQPVADTLTADIDALEAAIQPGDPC